MKSVKGIIVRGLGEGAYFMSMPHYQKEIKKKLGFEAYLGTLKVKIKKIYKDLLKNLTSIRIEGFTSNNKTFGGASCYKAKIKNINGAVIVPDINKNPEDTIEFIAPVNVKSISNLKDDDEIEIKLIN